MFSVDRTRGVAGQAAEAFEESDEMDFETFCDFERRREGNQGLKYSILRERFAKIDIDGSGTVSRTEFEAGAILDALSQNDAMKLFAAIDTDGNYSIDRQEFTRAVRATKGCQAVANSSIILAFNALDQDGSGDLTWSELRAKLQPEALTASTSRLRKLSAGRKSKSLGSTARLEIAQASEGADDGGVSAGVLVATQLAAMLHKNLARVVDLFRDWDENGDGKVDAKEFRKAIRALGYQAPREEIDTLFGLIDNDGSGEVDFRELHRALRPGHLEALLQRRQAEAEAEEAARLGSRAPLDVGDGEGDDDAEHPLEEVRVMEELAKQLSRSDELREEAAKREAEAAAENAQLMSQLQAAAAERTHGVQQLATLARRFAEARSAWESERVGLCEERDALAQRVQTLEAERDGEAREGALKALRERVEKLEEEKRTLKAQLAVLSDSAYGTGGAKLPPASPRASVVAKKGGAEQPSPSSIIPPLAGSSSSVPQYLPQLDASMTPREKMEVRAKAKAEEQARIARENREHAKRMAQVSARTK